MRDYRARGGLQAGVVCVCVCACVCVLVCLFVCMQVVFCNEAIVCCACGYLVTSWDTQPDPLVNTMDQHVDGTQCVHATKASHCLPSTVYHRVADRML